MKRLRSHPIFNSLSLTSLPEMCRHLHRCSTYHNLDPLDVVISEDMVTIKYPNDQPTSIDNILLTMLMQSLYTLYDQDGMYTDKNMIATTLETLVNAGFLSHLPIDNANLPATVSAHFKNYRDLLQLQDNWCIEISPDFTTGKAMPKPSFKIIPIKEKNE